MNLIESILIKQTTRPAAALSPQSATQTSETAALSPQNSRFTDLNDRFLREKRKHGSFEKVYDGLKNLTGLGLGSKKVEKYLLDSSLSEEKIENKIAQYRASQQNAAQNFGDAISAIAGLVLYTTLSRVLKMDKAIAKAKEINVSAEEIKIMKEFSRRGKVLESKGRTTAIMVASAALLGGILKWGALKLNRIGSEEFKVENPKDMSKKDLKKAKRGLLWKKVKADFKNFFTGIINGALAPVTASLGILAGVPLYLAGIFGVKALANIKNKKDKSKPSFIDTVKNNPVMSALFTAVIAIPAFKSAKFNKVLDENIVKTLQKLKDTKFKSSKIEIGYTSYQEIEDILLYSRKIRSILHSKLSLGKKITALTKENIFAVKFIQIGNNHADISKTLKEDCPPTRTIAQAQQEINRLMGAAKYTVSKLLGVGTVAETYLAKDSTGKEVCVKILKDGINAQKIEHDKKAFIALVTKGKAQAQLSEEEKYLVKNIENLAEGVAKEIDFENEAKAANRLRKYTTKANVVVPIEARPGIYIMEKAPGISLDTLAKYYICSIAIPIYNQFLKKITSRHEGENIPPPVKEQIRCVKRAIIQLKKELEKAKAKAPNFDDFDLPPKKMVTLLNKYMEIIGEQFTKLSAHGKTIHGDIHPGNIFVDLEALLGKKKGKLFTLIDTGNTIELSKTQALNYIKLTSYIQKANIKGIADYVMDGAILPANKTREDMLAILEKELKTLFFDGEIKLEPLTNSRLINITNSVLKKHGVIPSDSQLNLIKARQSAHNSFSYLCETFRIKLADGINIEDKKAGKALEEKFHKDMKAIVDKSKVDRKLHETLNLFKMSPRMAFKYLFNPNNARLDSEEYLSYILKQYVRPPLTEKQFEKELKRAA